jgi:hypothetical protein
MGVLSLQNTLPGAVTPVCNNCGITLCWDIPEEQYARERRFWDAWVCADCNGGKPLSRKDWYRQTPDFSLRQEVFVTVSGKPAPFYIGSGLSIADARSLWRAGFVFDSLDAARQALATARGSL